MLIVGLVVAGSVVQASFELVMVADNGTGSFASRKIHRFDGDNGVYLGSFGGFSANITGTHLDQSTNSLFVFTSDFRLAEYDYNTGALKRSYNTGVGSTSMAVVRPDQTSVVMLNGNSSPSVRSFPSAGSSGSFDSAGLANFYSGVWLDNDRFLAHSVGQLTETVVIYSVSPDGLSGTIASEFGAGINFASQMTYMAATDTVVHPGFENLFLYLPSQTTWGFVSTPGVENRHSSRAHDGFFTMGNRGGQWSLDKYDATFGQRGQFSAGMVLNPASMQTVLAPEPGTMLALGAGLAVLLRRSRSRAAG